MNKVAAFALVFCTACQPSIQFAWHPLETLRARASEPLGNHPARYLEKNTHILMVSNWRSPSYMQIRESRVLRIESEAGFDKYANVRVPYPAKGRFTAFAGRTISKSGAVTEISPARVYDTDAFRSEKRDHDVAVRVFAFPKVETGDILELHYIVEQDDIVGGLDNWLAEDIPIEKQKITLELTKDVLYSVSVYNMPGEWKTEDLGELWRLSIELANVPATRRETSGPDRVHHDPWWRFRALQFSKYRVVSNLHVSWDSSVKRRSTRLYFDHEEDYAGYHPTVDIAGCTDSSCKVQRALDYLKKEVPLRAFGGESYGRKAKDVLASSAANNVEKSRLLWWILKQQGIKAQFAFGGRFLDSHIDKTQPYSPALTHTILFVPAQADIPQELWIDPSCEYCALGEIPDWVEGSEFLLAGAEQNLLETVTEVKTKFVPVTGKPATPEREGREMKAAVDQDGKLTATIERQYRGRAAQARRIKTRRWTEQQQELEFQDLARERHRAAKLLRFEKLRCENEGSCVEIMELAIPTYAARSGDQLLVPLGILGTRWDGRFTKKKRKLDIDFNHAFDEDEKVILSVPEGYQLKSSPAPLKISVPGLAIDGEVVARGSTIEVTRRLRTMRGRFGVESYPAMREALEKYSAFRREVMTLQR